MEAILLAAFNNSCETVTIKTDNGPVRINASDFDPDTMELDGDEPVAPVEPITGDAAPVEPLASDEPFTPLAPDLKFVSKKGKKFIVVGADTNPIVGDGIEAGGYDTEQAAWDAIKGA